jgi:hypothetical protein
MQYQQIDTKACRSSNGCTTLLIIIRSTSDCLDLFLLLLLVLLALQGSHTDSLLPGTVMAAPASMQRMDHPGWA